MKDPLKYYSNNLCGTEVLLESMVLAGSFGAFAGKVIRIGHMGENAHLEKVKEVIKALGEIIKWIWKTINL